MSIFENGHIVKDIDGESIKIINLLSEGMLGYVYLAEYKGTLMALKWYKVDNCKDIDRLYYDISLKVQSPPPDSTFICPKAITEKINGSFGYVMELISEDYYPLSKLLYAGNNTLSFTAATQACISAAAALRKLHITGCCHNSLSDNNVFIDPINGQILIGDCDDINTYGCNAELFGKYKYMAPELVAGKGNMMSNAQSDRHTMAVIMFAMLFGSHPLEGKCWLVPCLTEERMEMLYGKDPVFVFDPENDSNRPVPRIHNTMSERWSAAPDYLKSIFAKAFSQEALKDPAKRPLETEWLSVLMRLKNDIVVCPNCNNEILVNDIANITCSHCHAPYQAKKTITLPGYTVVATPDTVIYKKQIIPTPSSDSLKPFLVVVSKADDPDSLGLKNISGESIKAVTPRGIVKKVENGGIIPLLDGITIKAYGNMITLSNTQK